MPVDNRFLDRISSAWDDSFATIIIAKQEYSKRRKKVSRTHIESITLAIGVILGEVKLAKKGPEEFYQRFLREILGEI